CLLPHLAPPCGAQDTAISVVPIVWRHPGVEVYLWAPSVALMPGTTGHAHALVWTAERGPTHAPIQWRSSRPSVVSVRVVNDTTVDLLYRRRGRAVLTAAAAGAAAWVILYTGQI